MVGTGTRLIDMDNRLAAHGLAVPGGSCATVGVAGLTLGGGVGVLGRAFGLASDNLQSLKIVTVPAGDHAVLTGFPGRVTARGPRTTRAAPRKRWPRAG